MFWWLSDIKSQTLSLVVVSAWNSYIVMLSGSRWGICVCQLNSAAGLWTTQRALSQTLPLVGREDPLLCFIFLVRVVTGVFTYLRPEQCVLTDKRGCYLLLSHLMVGTKEEPMGLVIKYIFSIGCHDGSLR